MSAGDGKCLSAARASKIERRCKPVPMIAKAAQYSVIDPDNGTWHVGTFKVVADLCPGVKTSTLKRRLDKGERNLGTLRKKPQPKRGAARRRPK